KKHIEKEEDAAKRWAEKWGFLKTPLEELLGDEKKEDPKPKLQLPDHLQIRPVTPVEKYIKYLKLPRDLLAGGQVIQHWHLNTIFKSKAAEELSVVRSD
ncbi:hypothetical protein IHE44_0004695, partial [Lamprotornis superbus]